MSIFDRKPQSSSARLPKSLDRATLEARILGLVGGNAGLHISELMRKIGSVSGDITGPVIRDMTRRGILVEDPDGTLWVGFGLGGETP